MKWFVKHLAKVRGAHKALLPKVVKVETMISLTLKKKIVSALYLLQVGVEFDPLVSDTHQSLTKLQYPGRFDTSVLAKALRAVRVETQSTPGVMASPATKRRRTDEVGDKAPSAKMYLK